MHVVSSHGYGCLDMALVSKCGGLVVLNFLHSLLWELSNLCSECCHQEIPVVIASLSLLLNAGLHGYMRSNMAISLMRTRSSPYLGALSKKRRAHSRDADADSCKLLDR